MANLPPDATRTTTQAGSKPSLEVSHKSTHNTHTRHALHHTAAAAASVDPTHPNPPKQTMGLLAHPLLGGDEGPLASIAWSRLPWPYRLLYLVLLSTALRRAWEACDDAVARSWSALLFDEGREEAMGGGKGGGLAWRCAFGYVRPSVRPG